MSSHIEDEIRLASEFGGRAEQLIVAKGQCPTGERNTPLMAYWSLAFEFHKAILSLITNRYYGAALALVRPLVECAIRAHLVIFLPKEVLKNILDDEYRTNFGTVGKEIDDVFGTGDFFQNFLTGAKDALHGYTHVGIHQLSRRFSGGDLVPCYSQEEITEVVRSSASAVFMVNNIVTKHFGFEGEWEPNNWFFDDWSKSH